MKLGQSQKQIQSTVITPQLQQAIKMLAMTHMEMSDLIAQELSENPLLEEIENEASDSDNESESDSEGDSEIDNDSGELTDTATHDMEKEAKDSSDEFDWEGYVNSFEDGAKAKIESNDGGNDEEGLSVLDQVSHKTMGLAEHLEWQIRMEDLSEEEINFALSVIGNLNRDGFLEEELETLITQSEISKEDAHKLLKLIQHLDPVGCATKNSKESLIVQARHLENQSMLLENIVRDHLEDLNRKNYDYLCKKFQCSIEDLKQTEMLISELHPRPGRLISDEETHYIVPDIYVKLMGDEYAVQINNDGIPPLKISQYYKSILTKSSSDKDSKDFIKEKLRSALWLLRSIENRSRTVEKVATAIVAYQQDFFRKGQNYMRPMILKDIAAEIGMHESTVSRVTTNKYMHTPLGIFELKYFFNTGVGSKEGNEGATGDSIKLKIKTLIESEDVRNPLSDERIVTLLGGNGITIARRTVAKYRDELGFLSSSKRKKT
ncbi:MAG: RNA polymerase factor sigma-54 [Bacteriovoracaceae bacterium]|nr:RNA polymerase factor sigma-54 [Bacteriovoracaceae bacterium]